MKKILIILFCASLFSSCDEKTKRNKDKRTSQVMEKYYENQLCECLYTNGPGECLDLWKKYEKKTGKQADDLDCVFEFEAQRIEYDKPSFKSIPLAMSYSDIIDIYTWKDDLGKNTLIITARKGCGDGYHYCDLRAYHYSDDIIYGNKPVLVREIKDFEKGLGIELDGVRLTDLDRNEIAEISITYTIRSRSVDTVKLIMLEKGEKYAIRGESKYNSNGCNYNYNMYGRDSFESAKSSFRRFAMKLFSSLYNCNVNDYLKIQADY